MTHKRMRISLALYSFLVVLIPKWFYAYESVNSIETSGFSSSVLSANYYSACLGFSHYKVPDSNLENEIKGLGHCVSKGLFAHTGDCDHDVEIAFVEEITSNLLPYIITHQANCFHVYVMLIPNIPSGMSLVIAQAKEPERIEIDDVVNDHWHSGSFKSR
jgi:hypothetical protein